MTNEQEQKLQELYEQLQTAIYNLEREYRLQREEMLRDFNHIENWFES